MGNLFKEQKDGCRQMADDVKSATMSDGFAYVPFVNTKELVDIIEAMEKKIDELTGIFSESWYKEQIRRLTTELEIKNDKIAEFIHGESWGEKLSWTIER